LKLGKNSFLANPPQNLPTPHKVEKMMVAAVNIFREIANFFIITGKIPVRE